MYSSFGEIYKCAFAKAGIKKGLWARKTATSHLENLVWVSLPFQSFHGMGLGLNGILCKPKCRNSSFYIFLLCATRVIHSDHQTISNSLAALAYLFGVVGDAYSQKNIFNSRGLLTFSLGISTPGSVLECYTDSCFQQKIKFVQLCKLYLHLYAAFIMCLCLL